jgi:hypothetical protein
MLQHPLQRSEILGRHTERLPDTFTSLTRDTAAMLEPPPSPHPTSPAAR